MDRTSPTWITFLHYGLYLVLVVIVIDFVILPALREETFGYTYYADGDNYRFRDFASILVMAKAMWSGEPTTPDGVRPGYSVESHLAVTRAWVGRDVKATMPFPYSPTMLYLLGPFCTLPMAWAFAAWSVLNLVVIGWLILQKDCPRLVGPIVFLTPTALSCFTLGQSAILAAAALIYLGRETICKPAQRGGHVWLTAVVLWALTARPQLAITAGVALLAMRHWRPVLIAIGLTLLSTGFLTALLGTRWIGDYITLVSHYDLVAAPPAFEGSLVPDYMNNLRALIKMCGVPDDWSSKISSGAWVVSLVVVLVSAWLRRLPPALVCGTCVLLQLLLCPHVNSYELVLLYAVLIFFLHIDLVPAGLRTKAVWAIPLILCLTTVGVPFEAARRMLLIGGLLAVAGAFGSLYFVALRSASKANAVQCSVRLVDRNRPQC
jgi:hypothetical protein